MGEGGMGRGKGGGTWEGSRGIRRFKGTEEG